MKITTANVTKKSKDYDEVTSLIKRAFPKNEQIPMWILNFWAKKDDTDFLAYYDEDMLCGISFTVSKNQTVFVLYLAVSDKIRSKGYGSAILDNLKERYADYEITLNIEPLDVNAENYEQRVKRLSFYERNGFYNTNKTINVNGDNFLILSTKENFDKDSYTEILRKMSFGLYRPYFNTSTD